MTQPHSPETTPEPGYPLPVVTNASPETMQLRGFFEGEDFIAEAQDRMLRNNPDLPRIVGQYMTLMGIEKGSPEAERASLLLIFTHELLVTAREIDAHTPGAEETP